jgi:hypothetical protein
MSSIKSLAKRYLPSLREIPARCWGLLYLVMIPSYALIYSSLPSNHFYHSTVQYEPSLKEDAGVILDQVRDVVVTNFREVHGGDIVEVNGWKIDVKNLKVSGLRPTSDEIGIKLYITIAKQTPQGKIESYDPFEISYPVEGSNMVTLQSSTQTFHKILSFKPKELILYSDEKPYVFDYIILFPAPKNLKFNLPVLSLPQSLNNKLQAFWRGTQKGLPADLSGRFWRMLYLSTITITTTGYGDIVPITNLARVLVAIEAMSGVVVAGLFLNAIVQDRSKQ